MSGQVDWMGDDGGRERERERERRRTCSFFFLPLLLSSRYSKSGTFRPRRIPLQRRSGVHIYSVLAHTHAVRMYIQTRPLLHNERRLHGKTPLALPATYVSKPPPPGQTGAPASLLRPRYIRVLHAFLLLSTVTEYHIRTVSTIYTPSAVRVQRILRILYMYRLYICIPNSFRLHTVSTSVWS